jgi:hypothetical protein
MTRPGMSMRAKAALLAVSAALLSAASAPADPVQSYDSYQRWLVACDNTLACVAKGFDDGASRAEMTVERDAGPSGALALTIRSADRFRPADLRIDGAPAGLAGPAWTFRTSEDESAVASVDPAAIRALVQKLRNATRITMGESVIPLAGFTAAMLRLDDRQGRIGGVTALLRTGPRPARDVPPPPPLPHVAVHPIRAQLQPGEERRLIALVRADQKALLAKEDCQSDTPQQPEAHALDQGRALVLIPCIMGAYQGSSLGFIARRGTGHAEPLVAPTPYRGADSDRGGVDYFTEADFDSATGMLSMATKGRGLADCGMSASWIWDGTAFRLSAMTMQNSCGGVEPGDWPILFRSTQ